VPTLFEPRRTRFGSRKPNQTPKSATNALQLRNPGFKASEFADDPLRRARAAAGQPLARVLAGRIINHGAESGGCLRQPAFESMRLGLVAERDDTYRRRLRREYQAATWPRTSAPAIKRAAPTPPSTTASATRASATTQSAMANWRRLTHQILARFDPVTLDERRASAGPRPAGAAGCRPPCPKCRSPSALKLRSPLTWTPRRPTRRCRPGGDVHGGAARLDRPFGLAGYWGV
jgi:hypothetical protein